MTDTNNNGGSGILNEQVTYIQHDIPGLEDGEYKLSLTQEVNDSGGTAISGAITNEYTLAVLGDRFRLKNPGDVLYSVFPDDNASGMFSTVLPHVVFTKSTFPWARYPTLETPYSPPQPGQDTDADVPTWITVLLLDDDDVAAHPTLQLPAASATMGDLFPTSLYPQSTLGDNYSYFYQATQTDELDPGDAMSDTIQVLDIPLTLFWQIAPTIDDLKLMAHVRNVSLINKATMPGISDVGEPTGTFSVVFGNRLPNTAKKTYAYLVSLEELQDFIPTDENGGAPSGTKLDPSKNLRLAVLKTWTFYSTGENAMFVDRIQALNGAPAAGTEAAQVNLRLDYNGSNPVVKGALEMGYVPLNHDVRTGEKTVSWYRGPLVPYRVDKARVKLPVASPDQAMIFDPTTGMLDESYCAAWTLGRLMALQDQAFSVSLYNWKKGLSQAVVNEAENELLSEAFVNVLQPAPPTGAATARVAAAPQAKASGQLLHQLIFSLKKPSQS
ncbi:MAG: hypothetical protein H6585_02545 [Flavobacteriales bacterium]|nr:hypothetical protein [Flavobacteriales bacterium]